MHRHPWRNDQTHRPRWIPIILVFMLAVGIGCRFVNLDGKVYWHDEAYTSIRAAGYLGRDIDGTLFTNQRWTAAEIQRYQTLKPDSTMGDTIYSLALEDPQHPPLYFMLARVWMQWFGPSLTATRSLAALLSLFSLPVIYALGVDLFQSRLVGAIAAGLLALSPFDILYAETNRQYSLQTFFILLSSWLLLRALRQRKTDWRIWLGYGLTAAAGLYTQPLVALTFMAHGSYVVLCCAMERPSFSASSLRWGDRRFWGRRWQPLVFFLGAMAIAALLFAPWTWVLATNLNQAIATTAWTGTTVGWDYLLKLWLLSFTSLFIDFDFGFYNPLTFGLRLPFLALILAAFYLIYRRTPNQTWMFVWTMVLVPFLLLLLPDLLLGGKRSAISRYLIPCYPGIQLAVAYYLGTISLPSRRVWQRWILPLLLVASITSDLVSLQASSWWSKDLSYHNDQIAQTLNQADKSVLMSDIGPILTNRGDLLSLSYELDPNSTLFLVSQSPDLTFLESLSEQERRSLFVFRPSDGLLSALEQRGTLTPVGKDWGLFQFQYAMDEAVENESVSDESVGDDEVNTDESISRSA